MFFSARSIFAATKLLQLQSTEAERETETEADLLASLSYLR